MSTPFNLCDAQSTSSPDGPCRFLAIVGKPHLPDCLFVFPPCLEKSMIPGKTKAALAFWAVLCGWASVSSASEPTYCLADLTHMNWAELEGIYRQAEPGQIPNGFAKGRVVYCPNAFLARAKSRRLKFFGKANIFAPKKEPSSTNGSVCRPFAGRWPREPVGSTANRPLFWITVAPREFGPMSVTRCGKSRQGL